MLNVDDNVRVALLGPVLIEGRSGALVEPPGTLAKALVVVLASAGRPGPRRPVSVETIIDDLWGDDTPRNARAALQTLVSRLRAVAADGLITSTASGYAIDADERRIDLGRARSLARSAEAMAEEDPEAAVRLVEEALALWRGEPGADLADSPIRDDLDDTAAAARDSLIGLRPRLLMAAGEARQAVEELARLVGARPLDEALHLAYIEALAAAGDRQQAIAAFGAFRVRLRDELGTSPGPALVDANARLLQDSDQPTAERPVRVRIGLRAAPNELLGRDDDALAIRSLLDHSRLVTILGAGGLGKTRLAQEIAAQSSLPAVIVAELASVRTDDDVVLALASALGIREVVAGQRLADAATRPDLHSRIISELSEWPTLLVMDNCEQVIDGAARWSADLLAAAPHLRILATSRSPLATNSEAVYPLDALESAGSSGTPGPAVRLFLERARAVRPGAALPLDVVSRLCDRLDGLPLAIELAAARVRTMTVEQIETRLENRFALLTGGDRSAPERHRTLQAVIEWSWNLLSPDEQIALRRLSIFPDGFSADAAERVAGIGPVEHALDGLIMQSLLSVHEHTVTGELRYRMLETVREFGQAVATEPEEGERMRSALLDWAAWFADDMLETVTSMSSYQRISVEQDNLVAALRQAMDRRDRDAVVTVFAALSYYWTVTSSHGEVMTFGEGVVDALRGYHPDAAHVDATAWSYVMVCATALAMGRFMGVRALVRLRNLRRTAVISAPEIVAVTDFLLAFPDEQRAQRVIERMHTSPDASTALLGAMLASQLAENEGRVGEAMAMATRAYDLAHAVGDQWRASMSAMMIAQVSSQTADHEGALRWVDRAEAGLQLVRAREDLAQLNWIRACNLIGVGRNAEATARLDAMVLDQDGVPYGMGRMNSLTDFGYAEIARSEGRTADAAEHFREGMRSFRSIDERRSPWYPMSMAATICAGVTDASMTDDEVATWARRLRSITVALHRARPGFIDKPVLGTAAVGWGAWALTQETLTQRAVELLALGEGLQSRQDLASLSREVQFSRAALVVGAEPVRAARAAYAALDVDERASRALVLLALPLDAAGV